MSMFKSVEIIKFLDSEMKDFFLKEEKVSQVYSFLKEMDKLYQYLESLKCFAEELLGGHYFEFKECLNSFFEKAELFENSICEKVLVRKIKRVFRKVFYDCISQSSYMRRGVLKPFGYPGDFEIVEAMYDNRPISKGLGFLFDLYFLDNNYVGAVRSRKEKMKQILKEALKKKKDINILNLACGSSREIFEIFNEEPDSLSQIRNFVLLDQDKRALDFSKDRIGQFSNSSNFEYIENDVLAFLREYKKWIEKWGEFDLIYSIGLADYLPNSVLGPLANYGFQMLSPEGKFIIAHKNTKVFTSPISDWGADWKFLPRNENDVENLLETCLKEKFLTRFLESDDPLLFYVEISRDFK